mgnify:CR=1 FL=1
MATIVVGLLAIVATGQASQSLGGLKSDTHRCCGNSLMETALVRFGVRY